MGYTSGAKILADIIDEIAAGLIATAGGYWTDADTTWNTTVKTALNARRALKYTNGSEVIYLTLEAVNTYWNCQPGTWYAKGLRVGFSATWDSVGHAPGSTTYRSSIPFEGRTNAAVDADLATLQNTYYLWIDANGFVITSKPEPNSNDNGQGSWVLVVERNPNKEYSDGFSNFYALCACQYLTSGQNDANFYFRVFMRLFAFQRGGWEDGTILDPAGIVYPLCPYTAFKSIGNGKVYYIKPIIDNSSDEKTPIFQSEMFFRYEEGQGLVDGDVIAIEGQTTKYLCKALDSPDTTTRLPIAMKYVA